MELDTQITALVTAHLWHFIFYVICNTNRTTVQIYEFEATVTSHSAASTTLGMGNVLI